MTPPAMKAILGANFNSWICVLCDANNLNIAGSSDMYSVTGFMHM